MSKIFSIFKNNGLAKLDELYFPEERFNWKEPWWNLEENQELRLGIQKELNAEIGPKHPLWGLKPVVFGKTDACDDVVVHLKDGRFACVHLVWHGKIDQYPDKFPWTTIYETASALQKFLDGESENYT